MQYVGGQEDPRGLQINAPVIWTLPQKTSIFSKRHGWHMGQGVFKNRPNKICGRQPLKKLMAPYVIFKT